jgi:3-deoxy-manno-octulosonate cytidylyltransferase (CMP-KDO synthetase)
LKPETLNFIGIIPARYASTRFPGKPLAMINGKTMIQRVYEQALSSKLLSKVIVATDDERIKNCVEEFGGTVVMTSQNHKSGTDRCFEAISIFLKENKINKADVAVNIQGDEPFINPVQIDILCSCFDNNETQIATLIKKIKSPEELLNPNVVKVVTDKTNRALYFSRSAIPYFRGKEIGEWINYNDYYKHIGIYAYRLECLEKIAALEMSALEKSESLEQLRWLENGFSIHARITDFESNAVDTPEDLLTINQQLSE